MAISKFNGKYKSMLDGLNEKLYSRTKYKAPEDSREPISQKEDESAPTKWESRDIDELLVSDRRKPEQYPLMKKVFMVSLLFSVCAGIAATLIYFKGDNFISTKNVEIKIEGPVSIAAGSPIDLEVTVTNKNNAPLDKMNLSIIYPDGTRSALDPTQVLNNTKEALDELGPGEKITKNERAVFLGSEGEIKKIRISVDYRVKGSNATFTKDKIFELTIGLAPVTVTLTRPESVNSGEEFDAIITISANSEETLKNLILRAEYPYGWSLKNAKPSALDKDKGMWLLGDLAPGEKKTITFTGILIGEDNEERTFRFFVGVGKNGGTSFDTIISSDTMVIAIDRPSINLGVKLNGESVPEYVAPAGKQIQTTINFRNNLTSNLSSPQIEVRLSGAALDRASVIPQSGGFYNSASNSILWNSSNSNDLNTLAPGQAGLVVFNFASQLNLPNGIPNQKIDLQVTLTGISQDTNSKVKVEEVRSVKIASEVSLSSKSLYSRGPFGNSGPIPPQAEKETSYTITLNLGNTRNDVRDAKVTGVLGANVKWNQEIYPGDSSVIYDEKSRQVTWNIGVLSSGTGFSSPGKEVSFRVSLIPSLGQVGGVPVLLGNILFSGIDTFTESAVRVTNPAVTTRISSDPRYVQGDETVVK